MCSDPAYSRDIQSDVTRHKAAGEIALDSNCRVNRSDGSHTFEVNTGKKTYYLTADTTHTVEDWVRTLQVMEAATDINFNATDINFNATDIKVKMTEFKFVCSSLYDDLCRGAERGAPSRDSAAAQSGRPTANPAGMAH